MRSGYHIWNDAEVTKLFHLRDEKGWDWPRVGLAMNLRPDQCMTKYHNTISARRRLVGPVASKAPNSALLERERRNEARKRQDLSGQCFGDPPPGFSELDKRRARA